MPSSIFYSQGSVMRPAALPLLLLAAATAQLPNVADAQVCSDATLGARSEAVNAECCDEPEEDCSSGRPATCNAGCARVLVPFFSDCAAAMVKAAAAFEDVVALCAEVNGGGGVPPPPPGEHKHPHDASGLGNPCETDADCAGLRASTCFHNAGDPTADPPKPARNICMIIGCASGECPTDMVVTDDEGNVQPPGETCCFDVSSCASMAQSTIQGKLNLPKGSTSMCLPNQIETVLGGFPAYCTCD